VLSFINYSKSHSRVINDERFLSDRGNHRDDKIQSNKPRSGFCILLFESQACYSHRKCCHIYRMFTGKRSYDMLGSCLTFVGIAQFEKRTRSIGTIAKIFAFFTLVGNKTKIYIFSEKYLD